MQRRAIALVLTVLLTLSGCTVHKVQRLPTASVTQPLPDKERIVAQTPRQPRPPVANSVMGVVPAKACTASVWRWLGLRALAGHG